jgi:hypothetical protein
MFYKIRGTFDGRGLGAGNALIHETTRRTQKFWGVGLLGGFQTDWHLSRNWSIFVNSALSLVYGPFDIRNHLQSYGIAFNSQIISSYDVRLNQDDIFALQPIYDLAIGLRWELPIYRSAYRVRVDAGWESHLYVGYNRLDANVSGSSTGATYLPADGDLTLSGLVLRAQLEF